MVLGDDTLWEGFRDGSDGRMSSYVVGHQLSCVVV